MRTHKNDELREEDIGENVKLTGWVNARRDHGGIIFISLRDRYGITQIKIEPDNQYFDEADDLRREDVIQITGEVVSRPDDMENPKLETGKIEIVVDELSVLNKSKTPKIKVEDDVKAKDEIRMKYRYLDLRREPMQENIKNRAKATKTARDFLEDQGFLEIETPMLLRSTPEGARDYVVPSRVNPGKIYSLPQSPQLYKQILMISGFDKYYQFAKCLRDEDLRSDRQPEFTQLDLEMSFVDKEDVMNLGEDIIRTVWEETLDEEIGEIPHTTYKDAMNTYGSDKPDIRIPWELEDFTELFDDSDLNIFSNAECVKALHLPIEVSGKEVRRYEDKAEEFGAKGLAWIQLQEDFKGPIAKFLSEEEKQTLKERTGIEEGEYILFVADIWNKACDILGDLKRHIYHKHHDLDTEDYRFVWVTEFPLFEWDEEDDRYVPMHHVFSNPTENTKEYLDEDPGKVLGEQYDLVLNGYEIGGGSIRIHRPDLQEKVMEVIGMSRDEAEEKFGFLLEALQYGAPPHGGIAFGWDRIVSLMNGTRDIRNVIAFPKNKKAQSPMDGSPTPWKQHQLDELYIDSLSDEARENIHDEDQ